MRINKRGNLGFMQHHPFSKLKDQRGISAVLIAVCLVMLLGFVALAIDIGHLAVARNELQNAADAGALAGARYLYNDDGQSINPNANQLGYDAAVANRSEQVPVEVNWPGENTGDVQRGHWSFATRTFTPNNSLNALPIWLYSEDELDSNTDFINAVRVRTRRQNTPIASWFAGIFGYQGFEGFAEAVAYIGYAGNVWEGDIDLPIAICENSIYSPDGTKLDCNVGRMINSGSQVESNETGGWTNFDQGFEDGVKVDNPCAGGTNAQEVRSLVNGNSICNGNGEPSPPNTLYIGEDMATNGGEIQTAFNALLSCFQNWLNDHDPNIPWEVTLPVVRCPGNNLTTCQEVTGVTTVKILWVTQAGEDPDYLNIPTEMNVDGIVYTCNDLSTLASRQACWNDFASLYNLKNAPGSDPPEAPYQKKAIYFHPDCNYEKPKGGVGGKNFGILARIPVLVD
jgi:Flp pilus assembly protein TadG